jgi:ABC-2 type transport system ATP-binding protein
VAEPWCRLASSVHVPIIRVEGLVKEFRRARRFPGALGAVRTLVTRQYTVSRAVDGIDFAIDEGELVGYLGPNGAGKSTTIKMLTGILVPTAGTVEVAGVVPWRERERNARQIGVVFGQRSGLWWDLPLIESLRLVGRLYEVDDAAYRANLGRFTELLELGEFLDTPVRQLSLGQRMRGDLAAAMLYQPRILYLDEPTIGLDVVAKERIRTFVAELNASRRTTVILTTHDLDDVERLCKRILLIDHGRVLYDGDVATLKARHAPYRELVVHLADAGTDVVIDGAEQVRREGGAVWLRFDPERVAAADLIGAVLAGHRVTDLSIVEPDLEGVIHGIYAARGGAG